jgi:hypothetical protein
MPKGGYVERLIGLVRSFGKSHLLRVRASYAACYKQRSMSRSTTTRIDCSGKSREIISDSLQ